MKIGLLHYAAPPVVGGVEKVIGEHARRLADAGHRVRILAGRGAQTDPRVEFALIPQVDSLHPQVLEIKAELDRGHVPPGFARLVGDLQALLEVHAADLDVLIAHNVGSLNKNLALTAALQQLSARPGAPAVVLWHHDLAWTTPRYQGELHPGYPWSILRTPWPGVQQVVISELRRQELARLMGLPLKAIRVVPNGIDLEGFLKLEAQTVEWIESLDLLSAAPLLLLPVRITRRKNIELAIHTLTYLVKMMPQARLVITGPLGPHNPANLEYLSQLRQMRADLGLEQVVCFLAELTQEFIPDAVIADFYRLADGLFLPSQEEGFGLPLLEAGLIGLPVFCTDLPPLRELGSDDVIYFSPQANPSELAQAIHDTLMTDPNYRLKIRVRQKYSWKKVYQQYIAPLLEELI
jgi:glycosyltransferase involved in cell wall biosynthesis